MKNGFCRSGGLQYIRKEAPVNSEVSGGDSGRRQISSLHAFAEDFFKFPT